MKYYVVGLRFDEAEQQVVLIRKNRPEWQRGKLNGVGGKVEQGETDPEAMVREFEEETSLKTYIDEWEEMGDISGAFGVVHFYKSVGSLEGIKTNTDETITILPVSLIHDSDQVIPNLKYIIPYLLHGEEYFTSYM